MEEVVRTTGDGLRCGRQPKPGLTVRGSRSGLLLVTSERLIFLSTGKAGMAGGALAGVGASLDA